jgi:hypothetical protein
MKGMIKTIIRICRYFFFDGNEEKARRAEDYAMAPCIFSVGSAAFAPNNTCYPLVSVRLTVAKLDSKATLCNP